jgi:hypothetical protein
MKGIKKITTAINKEQDLLVASSVTMPQVLLKGIGKFCKRPGCFKRIEGVLIKRNVYGKNKTYYRMPPKNKEYCSEHCRNIVNAKKHPFNKSSFVIAKIDLTILGNRQKFRLMRLYLKKGVNKEIKITPNEFELWNYLNSLSKYRTLGTKSFSTPLIPTSP